MSLALDWNRGVGGETTQDVIARIGDWYNSPCDVVFLSCGSNNIIPGILAGKTDTQIKDEIINDLAFIRSVLDGFGKTVVQLGLCSRTNWGAANPLLAESVVSMVNNELLSTPSIIFANINNAIIGDLATNLIDGIHFSQIGAMRAAREIYASVDSVFGTSSYSVDANVIYTASPNTFYTANKTWTHNYASSAGKKAYAEIEVDFPYASQPQPNGVYLNLKQNGVIVAQCNMPMPPPEKPQTVSQFPYNHYRQMQIDYPNKHFIMRTPIASGLLANPQLTAELVISGAATKVRVFNVQIVAF